MTWVDAHAHWAQAYPLGSSGGELELRMQQLREEGMSASVQAGVDPADWKRQLELSFQYPDWILPVLGLHPWWVKDHADADCEQALGELESVLVAHSEQLVAIGELGLDYSTNGKQSAERQARVFQRQLELAARFNKPVVLHIVHAHEPALAMLRAYAGRSRVRGLVHAFSGSFEVARLYLDLGLKLSIGPGISEPGRFLSLKKCLPRLDPRDWVLESDWAGEKFFRAAQAASGLTGRPLTEIASQCLENLQEIGLLKSENPS